MSIELRMLTLASLLGIVQLFLAAHLSTKQRGMKWNLSPRDEKKPDLTGVAGRLDRAFKNLMETFPFFVAAVLTVTAMRVNTNVSALGSIMYFAARVLYVPVYAVGTPVLRTLIWVCSFVGILLVMSALI
jgi:uncharacterized MAPEG superfamily protein